MADIHDDVRGKIGDVSGFEVGGKIGDVSGKETFDQIVGLVTNDHRKELLHCLELRVNRLEHEIFAIARWLDRRTTQLRVDVESIRTDVDHIRNTQKSHEERIAALEHTCGVPPPSTPPSAPEQAKN